MIRFDFSGVSNELIGERGISSEDIKAVKPLLSSAHRALMKARDEKEILFYDLSSLSQVSEEVINLSDEIKGFFTHIVHLGIGGSSLGPKAILSALKDPFHNYTSDPKFFFLDNIDPEYLSSLMDLIPLKDTLFIVVSKSGATAETAAQFMIVLGMLQQRLGEGYIDHLVFITDPKTGVLRRLASSKGVRSLSIPPEIGGRFSVLTPVGLLPAALSGVDITRLLEGASKMKEHVLKEDTSENPAYLYSIIHFLAFTRGINISVLMAYSNALYDLADWYRQLWAESLGKRYSIDSKEVFTGQTPVKALGATDQHSQVQLYREGPFDKIINIMTVDRYRSDITIPDVLGDIDEFSYLASRRISELIKAEARATMASLIDAGRMTTHISLDTIDEETLGALFMFFEAATAFMGCLLKINPFDQPGVELGKHFTFSLMGRQGFSRLRKGIDSNLRTLPGMNIEI